MQALENLARGETAKESERLRTLMIDSITHQLRAPLASIKRATAMLLSRDALLGGTQDLLTTIYQESDDIDKLVVEATEMARLDAQQVQMHFVSVDVSRLLEEAIRTCSWVRDSHPIVFQVPVPLSIKADPDFLKRVVSNLAENAAKHSPPGSPMTITAEARNTEVFISVADRGIGIDPSEQTLVFNHFYRAQLGGAGTPGMGMCLSISRSIVEAHGGQITLTSQPGQGSVFTFPSRRFSPGLTSESGERTSSHTSHLSARHPPAREFDMARPHQQPVSRLP